MRKHKLNWKKIIHFKINENTSTVLASVDQRPAPSGNSIKLKLNVGAASLWLNHIGQGTDPGFCRGVVGR